MLRFANPEFLHLYWGVPLLILFFWISFRRRRALLARLGDEALIARLSSRVSRARRVWKAVLVIVTFTFLVLALADPMIGTRVEEVKREGVDIFIALDVSKSMLAEDIAPNRFEKARYEIAQFIDRLRGDRVGLVVFSGLAFVQCPLTLDYSASKLFLEDIYVGIVPQAGTNIGEAIRTATRSFVAEDTKQKVLVLITDGEEHEGDPLEAARAASEAGVIIHAIGVGSPQGAPIPEYDDGGNRIGYKKDESGQVVTTRLDIPSLEALARASGGTFHVASGSGDELDKVYSEIFSLDKKELSARQFTQFEHRFQIFLVMALVVLLLETMLGERRSTRRLTTREVQR